MIDLRRFLTGEGDGKAMEVALLERLVDAGVYLGPGEFFLMQGFRKEEHRAEIRRRVFVLCQGGGVLQAYVLDCETSALGGASEGGGGAWAPVEWIFRWCNNERIDPLDVCSLFHSNLQTRRIPSHTTKRARKYGIEELQLEV